MNENRARRRIQLLRTKYFGQDLSESEEQELIDCQSEFFESADESFKTELDDSLRDRIKQLRSSALPSRSPLESTVANQVAESTQNLVAGLVGEDYDSMKTREQASEYARNVINTYAFSAACLSFVPGSTLVLTAAQGKMVADIARCYKVKTYDVTQLTTALGSAFAGRWASETLNFFPGVGWLVKSAVASAITKGAGEIINSFFWAISPLPEKETIMTSAPDDQAEGTGRDTKE